MAFYTYICQECCEDVEIQHSIKEDARTHHPHGGPCETCEGHGYTIRNGAIAPDPCEQCNTTGYNCDGKLKRLIAGGTSFNLKGSGWTAKQYV